jgi:thiamine biosynthesis lipoprotein
VDVAIDLDGIAEGYAMDRAAEVLQRADVEGGTVDVGGDLRCFGRAPAGAGRPLDIRNPFAAANRGALAVGDGAVCISGSYARFSVIAGTRYGHILDPRTAWPAEVVPSATVVAPAAMTADVWATALSVLGAEGRALLRLAWRRSWWSARPSSTA